MPKNTNWRTALAQLKTKLKVANLFSCCKNVKMLSFASCHFLNFFFRKEATFSGFPFDSFFPFSLKSYLVLIFSGSLKFKIRPKEEVFLFLALSWKKYKRFFILFVRFCIWAQFVASCLQRMIRFFFWRSTLFEHLNIYFVVISGSNFFKNRYIST